MVAPPNQLLATVDSVANAKSKTDENEIFMLYCGVCASNAVICGTSRQKESRKEVRRQGLTEVVDEEVRIVV